MMPARISRSERGFTLIEVIGALMIFSFGVLMILNLSGVLSVQLRTASLRSMVSVAVQENLDSLQLRPYDSLPPGTTSDTLVFLGETFNVTREVVQSTALIREVQVTVEPADGSGPDRTASAFVARSW